jgi:signal transduction histidine kinase
LELQLEEVDLAQLVHEVVGRFREEITKAGIEVTVKAEPNLKGWWDRSRVDQVLTNLFSNAVKYGQGRPVEITAKDAGAQVVVAVRDRGMGIDGQNPERVFARFERAADARSYSGLGLGLYIVRQLVQAHGGTVVVTTKAGQGSVFTVAMPKSPIEPSPQALG